MIEKLMIRLLLLKRRLDNRWTTIFYTEYPMTQCQVYYQLERIGVLGSGAFLNKGEHIIHQYVFLIIFLNKINY